MSPVDVDDHADPGADVSNSDSEPDRGAEEKASLDIDRRVVLASFLGGAAGLVAMTPALVGVPALFGVFQEHPLVDVAELGRVLGLEPGLALGVVVFAAGGTVALPLLFVVASGFLPPREPRATRGVTFATIMWTGFAIAFWPGWRNGVFFLALSLTAHWVYGYVLGLVMERFAHVPEHTV